VAGETIKSEAIALAIRPWSRTSHVVTWLTPGHGPVSTIVKGAVRPKSAFLGQYDLYYTCEILYYARAAADLHALREAVPVTLREHLRTSWRANALAGYACSLVGELAPPDADAAGFYGFLADFLDRLHDFDGDPAGDRLRARTRLVRLETGVLRLAGLEPDFTGFDPSAAWTPFAVDRGRPGEGLRTVRLSPAARDALEGRPGDVDEALRFLGIFLAYHIERPADIRRSLVNLLK